MARPRSESNHTIPSAIPVLLRDWHLAVSQWGRWTHPAGYRHPAIISSSNLLFWIETGAATVYLGDERFLLKAGMLAFVPANRALYYQVCAGSPFRHCTVHFDLHTGKGVSLDQLRLIPRCSLAVDPAKAAELFGVIAVQIGQRQLAAHLKVCAALWQLLTMMSEAAQPRRLRHVLPHGKAYEAMALIEANFQRPLSVKEIAGALRITPDYLATVFEQTFDISPKRQIQNLRLVQAHSLLLVTDQSVKEIAYTAGFQSLGAFERAFRRFFKGAPQEIRAKQMPSASGPTFRYHSRKPGGS